jgi:replication factor A1
MHTSKDKLYQKIKDLITKQEFEKNLKEIIKESDELIDEDTAALLIVDKLGKNEENIYKISKLESNIECTVFGKVTNIRKSRSFNRKNGTTGKVINLELSDETGNCNLALWDKDVDLVNSNKIKVGTNIKIINGYVKEGFNGIELNVGRYGLLEVEPTTIPIQINKELEKTISGKIIEIEPTRAFFKDNGEFGFVTAIKLHINSEIKQITIWDEKVKEIQKFKQGQEIEINNFDTKKSNGKVEIHLNSKSNIKRL